jgi:CO/xanthine dehydrogenase Mo-binding subunit/aerobic-type carbon monoxide dehydrogenase small subunit (CoxS/CutS family)
MSGSALHLRFRVNGRDVALCVPPMTRLTDVLREHLGLTGTKVGCEAGDCGACTVLLDGRQVCACLIPALQLEGRAVTTVEGLAADPLGRRLQQALVACGAIQCGICTPGMAMAAFDLLRRKPQPTREEVEDVLGGVLCRCTGYVRIIEAVLAVAEDRIPSPPVRGGVGVRLRKRDGDGKVTGADRFGADEAPPGALWLRVLRSAYARARFSLGDLDAFRARHTGIHAVLTAQDVPGRNRFGIYPDLKDQPVLAEGEVRFRGEAVLLLVGEREAVEAVTGADLPLAWTPLAPITDPDVALSGRLPPVHADRPDNVLVRGRFQAGDVEAAFASAPLRLAFEAATSFVEHAYIEPEAGWAQRIGDRIEITVTTQTPYMDRDEVAGILGIAPEQVRIRPTCCGGGFGGKLDLSVQPYLAIAAWKLGVPVRLIYDRIESMASTTKRHPARMRVEAAVDGDGRLVAVRFRGLFDTGAYASWGPTVAGRVPLHASGPYRLRHVDAEALAVYTNNTPAGAFRGFGVPQATLAMEQLMDELALRLGRDPLELRLMQALRPGDVTPFGQRLESCGLVSCLEALRPAWRELRAACEAFNQAARAVRDPRRRGVGLACMWYGCGNTGMSNPSEIRVGLRRDGRFVLFNGVQDIGQGSNTIMVQILASALGVPEDVIEATTADTDRTLDAGKTSASRQTYVSGRATQLAGEALRAAILRLANAGPEAVIRVDGERIIVEDGAVRHILALDRLPADADGIVLEGRGRFDPPSSAVEEGRGRPYGAFAFGAQLAVVEVDCGLGTVRVRAVHAAHDVGRAINPQQVEGQIQGGIAQGIGLALMEEYIPGRTENLHDYLIPTVGDMPEIVIHLIEDPQPDGPFGAKGVGEPALIPTAPAILNAIRHATGVRPKKVPVLPHRLLAALREQGSVL